MNSRERVKKVFNHQEADMVPIDFGGTVVTSIDTGAHIKLRKHFRIENENDPIIDYSMGTVEPCDQLKNIFDSDFRRVSLNVIPPQITDDMYTDGFGIKLRKAIPNEYFDVIYNPLAEATINDLDEMTLPNADNPALYYGLKEKAKNIYKNSNYAIVADFGVPGFYETSQKLRGYENLACDLLVNTEFVNTLYGKLLELQKIFFKNYLDQVGMYAQVICYADDLGMQDRLQISPETYREILKPYHTAIFKFIHEHTDAKIMLHSCGSIKLLIGDLIEAGIDILNPVQTRASDMSPTVLKEEFGDKLIFWGGFDEQYVLPFGTKKEISAEVESLMKILGENGGYVFGPSHNIQSDTPIKNIVAMYNAAKKYRDYKKKK